MSELPQLPQNPSVAKIVDAALKSGAIDPNISIGEVVRKIGSDLDPVAGYVAAWDRYVLVVAKTGEITPKITFEKS